MYIIILGFINCCAYTMTQAPFSKFLEDVNLAYEYAPLVVIPYFLRFLWDRPVYNLFSKINRNFFHREMMLGLSLVLLFISGLFLFKVISCLAYVMLFSITGATQQNIVESYKITVKKHSKETAPSKNQTTMYLLGYRGAKTLIGSGIFYIVGTLLLTQDIYTAYRYAFFIATSMICCFSACFYIISDKTNVYESKLSVLEPREIINVFKAIKKKQSLVIFINTVFFRFADTMLSYVYFNLIAALLINPTHEYLSTLNLISTVFSLLGLLFAKLLKDRFEIKYLLYCSGILQAISFLGFIFLNHNSTAILIACTFFKIIAVFATDIIATFMRSNAAHTESHSASAYVVSESSYKFFSFTAGFLGSFLFRYLGANALFMTCIFFSLLSTFIFFLYREKIMKIY